MSRLLAGVREMSLPSTRTWPEVGWSKPASRRSAVVLPQPEGPSRASSSPGSIVRSRPSSADIEPKTRRTLRYSTVVPLLTSSDGAPAMRTAVWSAVMSVSTDGALVAPGVGAAVEEAEQQQHELHEQQAEDRHGGLGLTGLGGELDQPHGERLGVEQDRRDRVLAHHEGEAEEARVDDRGAEARGDHPQQHRRPAGAEVAGGLDQGPGVDGGDARVDGAVDERHRED